MQPLDYSWIKRRRTPPSHRYPSANLITINSELNMENSHTRHLSFNETALNEKLLRREWLLTNGLGGFSSGTLAGGVTRRYHGLLLAALPAPLARTVMLSRF